MRPLPQQKVAARAADQDRIGKAFAAFTGGKAPSDGSVAAPSGAMEKEEDQDYAEIQDLLGQMEKVLVRLREIHQAPAEQEQHQEQATDMETGSPSAQGAV